MAGAIGEKNWGTKVVGVGGVVEVVGVLAMCYWMSYVILDTGETFGAVISHTMSTSGKW